MVNSLNKKKLFELVKVNLRYANPQQTTQQRDKGKSGAALTRSLYRQYLYSGLVFLVVYGVVTVFLDFSKLPGIFTYYVALFGIIAFSQGISSIYNVFFESNDLPSFLPLPFSQTEIFTAKILVVILSTIAFVMPVGIVFILTALRAGIFPVLAILLGLIAFGLFLSIIFSLCSFIVFGLTKTGFFKRHRQLVTSLLLIISTGTAVVGILAMNWQNNAAAGSHDRAVIVFLEPFFYCLTEPFKLAGLLSWGSLIVMVGILLVAFSKLFLPKLNTQLLATAQTKRTVRKKRAQINDLHHLLVHYNVQLINNASLLMQMFSNSVMLPLIFTISFAFSGGYNFAKLSASMLGVTFVGGGALAIVMTNQTSLLANIISLDRENFSFVRSLPLTLKNYLKEKFLFALKLQGTVTLVVTLIMSLVFHFPLPHIISLVLGGLLGTYLAGLYYFYRDYRLLRLDWTEVSQLFSRGGGNLSLVFSMFGIILVSVILLIIYAVLVKLAPILVNTIVGVVLVVLCFLWVKHYRKIWQTKL